MLLLECVVWCLLTLHCMYEYVSCPAHLLQLQAESYNNETTHRSCETSVFHSNVIKVQVFWDDVMLCCWVSVSQNFTGMQCLHLQIA
jgi:hypothetical protein